VTGIDSWAALRDYKKALHRSNLKPRTILLGLALAEHANEKYDFRAWPSQQTLADETGTWRRNVRARLGELIAAGWVASDGGGKHKAARYTFQLGAESAPSRASDQRPIAGAESAPSRASDQRHQRASDQRHQRAPDQRPDSPKDVPKESPKDYHSAAKPPAARAKARSAAAPPLEEHPEFTIRVVGQT
jgi:hypothetical protein